jgi:hypothetical protein
VSPVRFAIDRTGEALLYRRRGRACRLPRLHQAPSFMQNKNPTGLVLGVALLCAGFFGGGCASIVHGGNRLITINSDPAGAKASISKAGGEVVSVQTTPCTVSLDPKRGYFKGQSYTLKLELAGYQTAEVGLRPTLSGWYFGNLLFGGLIGMIAVDPVTGSMWNIEPGKIEQKFTAAQASMMRNNRGFVVVLVSELTASERAHMAKIN